MLTYFVVILIVLFGFCGLAIDMGRVELRTLQLQAIADASAVDAATELQRGTSTWQNTVATDLANGEYLNNIPATATSTVQQTAVSGPYLNDYSAVQTSVQQTMSTIFLGLVSSAHSSINLSVHAVAEIPPCTYFFANPAVIGTTAGVYEASAGLNPSCPVYSAAGVDIDGFGHINGGQVKTAGPASSTVLSGWIAPNPIYSAPVLGDPLAWITAPTFVSCNHTGASYTVSTTIFPGTYCGGLTISNGTVTMSPGLYIITGGVNITGATIQGTGVTMYLTKGGGSGFGTFSLQYSTMNVSAPTDSSAGGIPGIVLFGDRTWSGGNEDFIFNGASYYGDGIIYATHTGVYDWSCNMYAPNYFNIVAANMYSFGSSVNPSSNYSNISGGSPLRTVITLVQ
jgi:hypothetical protein